MPSVTRPPHEMRESPPVTTIDLSGPWTLIRPATGKRYGAQVPGCVHEDLLRAGVIEDPFFRTNERDQICLARESWIYERTFAVKSAETNAALVFEGLDTLARVELNGALIGEANNMFRRWEFAVGSLLKQGRNTLRVVFASPLPLIERRHRERPLHSWGGPLETPGRAYVRKLPCSFGWDWGPVTVTAGIWKPVALRLGNPPRIQSLYSTQHHSRKAATLAVTIGTLDAPPHSRVRLTLSIDGHVVAATTNDLKGASLQVDLNVRAPRLWWPAGMGEQPLYTLKAELLDEAGNTLATKSHRLGLRELRLDRHADKHGESFQFTANGRPFFAKGANWIPADAIITRLKDEDYRALLQAARDANMNMIRAWGGGFYENDAFFDLCDEMGLCVWQDFIFGCSMYPTFDDEWMENVRIEAREAIVRLRHHACVALWCGNNELEQGLVNDTWTDLHMDWKLYGKLFDEMLPAMVQELDPQRDYWPCSPHSPTGDRKDHRNEACGDAHLWDVWHLKQPFEWYRTTKHRFVSEFGFQSFPEPLTVRAFTEPEDRHVASTVMEAHQRSGVGNTLIMSYMLDWFRLPNTFDNTLHVTQILQAMAIKYAVEHWRRMKPRTMGTLYWQLNDTWPGNSWSSLDYFHRWKGLHYYARAFYAPILLSLVEDGARGVVDCHVTSDVAASHHAELTWRVVTTEGKVLAQGSKSIRTPNDTSRKVHSIALGNLPLDQALVFASLRVGGEEVSANLAHFARPKNLHLRDPKLRVQVRAADKSGRRFRVSLAVKYPALYVFAEMSNVDASWSDRYFHMQPGVPKELTIETPDAMTVGEVLEKLTVNSLWHTYEHPVETARAAAGGTNGSRFNGSKTAVRSSVKD